MAREKARAWCPYCREYHKDDTWEAAVAVIEETCEGAL